ncbi:Hsp20/alpha crystallin family protein [Brachyspira pilosicoli]|uniref:Hsp20/alpha crystallin family protein n=1 Tax=Brachyspira pilosicoli TaxID=52584 RepID=UPI001C66E109|nr:Hsp20/alpha crystallin family protein [Brachyspira pilosicoli]MBW5397108.1 Hsp20/alpha crystallin family protein [Brachyspira pilosicoli]
MSRIFLPALHSILDDFDNFYNEENSVSKYSDYKIEENDNSYTIEMDMPGVRKEDLDIGIKENMLSIYAERKRMSKTDDKEEVVSKYEQSFNISVKGIDIENISANFENGVLTLTLPKKEEVKYEKKIEIA